eukprot:4608542-Amphidinium_carterae.1
MRLLVEEPLRGFLAWEGSVQDSGHFRSSIFRKLGCSTELDRIDYNGMRTKLAVCPIGPNVLGLDLQRRGVFKLYHAGLTTLFNVIQRVDRT